MAKLKQVIGITELSDMYTIRIIEWLESVVENIKAGRVKCVSIAVLMSDMEICTNVYSQSVEHTTLTHMGLLEVAKIRLFEEITRG